jgi:hypothetical protein
MYLCGGVPIFFYFHILTTEVIPYNALNSEFVNFETPCMCHFAYINFQILVASWAAVKCQKQMQVMSTLDLDYN